MQRQQFSSHRNTDAVEYEQSFIGYIIEPLLPARSDSDSRFKVYSYFTATQLHYQYLSIIFFYNNSMHHTTPQVKINLPYLSVLQCSNLYENSNYMITVAHHNADAVEYEQTFRLSGIYIPL